MNIINIAAFALVAMTIFSVFLLWSNLLLRERLQELEEECVELDRIGNRYRELYHKESVMKAFSEPLDK